MCTTDAREVLLRIIAERSELSGQLMPVVVYLDKCTARIDELEDTKVRLTYDILGLEKKLKKYLPLET
jgi:hypothetical protein